MKIQIIVDKNLVIMDDTSVNIDCTKFKEQFIFCEVNGKEKWIEKETFNGREQPKQWNEIEEFIDIAKSKSNLPNSYSVWDENTKAWVEDNADAVGMAVKADPSLIVRIKELEFEAHKLDVEAKQKEKQAELDEVNAYLADVQSARNNS